MTDPIEIGFHAPALPDMTPWGVVKEPHFRERLADVQPMREPPELPTMEEVRRLYAGQHLDSDGWRKEPRPFVKNNDDDTY